MGAKNTRNRPANQLVDTILNSAEENRDEELSIFEKIQEKDP